MRSRDMVLKALQGGVKVVSQSSGEIVEITGQNVTGRGPVLYVDGQEASLHVIEAQHGRSPLFDPQANGLNDWCFESAD